MSDLPPSADMRNRDDGELLAAYLDGELDDIGTARLERRLRTDTQLAARLDAIAHTRGRLQRLDAVEPPAGFRQRLDDRLAAERSSSSAIRQRRAHLRRWQPLVAAAALVLILVTGAGIVLSPRASELVTTDADDAAEAGMAEPEAPAAVEDDGAAGAVEKEGADGEDLMLAPESATGVPVVENDTELAALFRDLLTQEPAGAEERAGATDPIEAQERREREVAGLEPADSCLARAALPGTPLAVRVADVAGERLLAIATRLGDSPESGQIVLLDPASCEPRRVVPLAGG